MSEQQEFRTIALESGTYETRVTKKFTQRKPYEKNNPGTIKALIPGVVAEVDTQVGTAVKKGDTLMILEAMKMLNRIAAPAVIMGFLVSIGAIAFNEYVVPWANTAYRNVVYYEIQGNNGMKSQEHIILKDIQDGKIQRLVYARRYDGDTQTLQGVTMQDFNEDGKVSHVENAEYAEYSMDKWIMHNGMLYDISEGQSEHSMRFDTQVLPIKANPKQIVREQKDPEELTMKELKAQIRIMKTQYVDTNKLEAELYQRITVPMASLIFALIGVPLGLQPTRNSSSALAISPSASVRAFLHSIMGASVLPRSSATMLAVIAAILILRIQFNALKIAVTKRGQTEPLCSAVLRVGST